MSKEVVFTDFQIDLQLFAEDVEVPEVEDVQDDPVYYEDDDVPEEPEDEAGDEEEDVEDEEELDEDVEEEEAEEDDVEVKDSEAKFTKEQQAVIDNIIAKRLKRAEDSFVKDLSQQAGTSLEQQDVTDAARLWGFLKMNPALSGAVQKQIDFFNSNAQPKTSDIPDTREQEIELKEAILDMKESDSVLRKNMDSFVDWTEENGFEINDKKGLELAVLAWKGANGKLLRANEALREQRKTAQKSKMKRRASVEGGNKAPRKPPVDYRKMSDRDILASEGIPLFTED